MNSFNALWERTLKLLETRMSGNNHMLFDTWIKNLKPEIAEGDYCYLEVANDIHKDLVENRFSSIIEACLREAAAEANLTQFLKATPIFMLREDIETLKQAQSLKANRTSQIQLNPNYTFDTFIVGSSNRFAYAAADGVAKFPGQFNNPLFIYGGVGLGKTHLMHAIGNQILNNFPEFEIMYVTCETFTNDLIESLQRNSMSQFRNKYRKVDVLLIDDIQFLANKDSTQEEFFHTFNTLYEAGKQIVISSDKPSTEIPRLAERLLSRFRMGMSADIQLPDFETRVAILRNKTPFLMEQTGCSIPMSDEVFFYIANKSNTNIRDLEGALRKVIAYAKLNSLEKPLDEIGVDIATEALRDFFTEPVIKAVTPKLVLKNICDYFEISEEDLKGKKKNREIAFPRQICMYILRNTLDMTYPKIGEILGGRDHSTVMHADEKIKEMMEKDTETANIVNDIIHKIKD